MRLAFSIGALVALIFTSLIAVALGQNDANSTRSSGNTDAGIESGDGDNKPRVRRDLENKLKIGRVKHQTSDIVIQTNPTSSIYSDKHPAIHVWNVGRVPLRAESVEGDIQHWTGVIQGAELEPGQSVKLKTSGSHIYTALKIYTPGNTEKQPSMYYAFRGSGAIGLNVPPKPTKSLFPFDYSVMDVLEMYLNIQVLGLAFSQNFLVGFGAQILMNVFFPAEEKDPWDDIKGKVEKMIKESQLVVINAMLENDIEPLDDQIKDVMENAENPDIRMMFNNLISRLISMEKKFVFRSKGLDNGAVNYHILPLFARVINLKLSLHSWGMTYAANLSLTDYDFKRMNKLASTMIDYAVNHIESVEKERLDNAYNEEDPDKFFDNCMEIRTTVGMNGRQYYSSWFKALDPNNKTTSNHILAYSPYFGSSTPSLWMQAMLKFGQPPLTPPLIPKGNGNFKVPTIWEIKFYFEDGKWSQPLIGIELLLEGNKRVLTGYKSRSYYDLDVHPHRITKIHVSGRGVIDCIIIHFSNRQKYEFGGKCWDNVNVYELEDHHIVGFFLSNDNNRGDQRAVNLAVSYAQNPYHNSKVMPELNKVRHAKG